MRVKKTSVDDILKRFKDNSTMKEYADQIREHWPKICSDKVVMVKKEGTDELAALRYEGLGPKVVSLAYLNPDNIELVEGGVYLIKSAPYESVVIRALFKPN